MVRYRERETYDEFNTIQLITGLGGTGEFYEDTYSAIIGESHPVVYVYYGDENKYPELAKALEYNNKSEKEYLIEFTAGNPIKRRKENGIFRYVKK